MNRVVLLILGLAACSGDDELETADPCAGDPDVTWQGWGDGFFGTYCRGCHSTDAPDRYGAPEDINFDTRADVLAWEGLVRQTVLEDETMPVGGGVYPDDLELLDTLLRCGLE